MENKNINTNEVVNAEYGSTDIMDLIDSVGQGLLPPFELELEDYNTESFIKGIDDASHICGVITAMLNTGVSEEFILTYLINKENIQCTLDSIKMNNETNIEIGKNQKIMLEKQEL